MLTKMIPVTGCVNQEVNPAPECPQAVVDFCNRKSLGSMHVYIRSLLPKFVLLTALADSTNPDVLAVSESWIRKATKNSEISIPNYNIFQDRTAKGVGSMQGSVILSRSGTKTHSQSVRKAKASFFKQKCASCSSNSQKFWDTLKSMENKSTSS